MTNALHDGNARATIIAASKNDGVTVVPICALSATHSLCVEDATTGTDNGNNFGNAVIDENSVSGWTALSSAGDGSIVEIYGDPANNKLLITHL